MIIMARRLPLPGEVWRHFKGKDYLIIDIATHTETKEDLVIYRSLYDEYDVHARPVEMFMSPVDKNKYPDSNQEYRFRLTKRNISDT